MLGIPLSTGIQVIVLVVFAFLVWSIVWKGLALWHSARRKQGWWFFILLLINTGGILEIVYLFLVAKVPMADLFNSKK
jgi:methionyl-tRNA synthetase